MYLKRGIWYCKIARHGKRPLCKSLGRDKKLAKVIEAKLRAEVHEGKFFDKREGEYITVSHLLEIYRDRHAKPNKGEVSQSNDKFLGRSINRIIGKRFLNEISPTMLEDYMAKRREEGVGDVTIHHELYLLKHAFILAKNRWDLVDCNPFDKIKLPKGDRKRVRYLKPEEEKQLHVALEGKGWLRSVVILARETGLRLSNLCELGWEDVDLFQSSIEVQRTKNGKPVWIPLSDVAHAELVKVQKVRRLGTNKVFVRENGKQLTRYVVYWYFKALCKEARIEDFCFHDLRHDFCSRLVQAGQPLNVVGELAGHSDLSSTQRYAHLSPKTKRMAIDSLNGYPMATSQKEKGCG